VFLGALLQHVRRPLNIITQSDKLELLIAGLRKFSDLTIECKRYLINKDIFRLALHVLKQSFTAVSGARERHSADAQLAVYGP
jgi:phosphopantetheine adenylyltransferase